MHDLIWISADDNTLISLQSSKSEVCGSCQLIIGKSLLYFVIAALIENNILHQPCLGGICWVQIPLQVRHDVVVVVASRRLPSIESDRVCISLPCSVHAIEASYQGSSSLLFSVFVDDGHMDEFLHGVGVLEVKVP